MDAAQLQAALLSFEDDSDAAGERYDPASGARFNALHAHEELVRLLPLGVRAVAFMLHERCRMLARTGFSDLDRELWTAQGREDVLRCGLHLKPILRLEPAELLPDGETRSNWLDEAGARHALAVRWSATGHALRVVLVDAPPTSHREWAAHVEMGDEVRVRVGFGLVFGLGLAYNPNPDPNLTEGALRSLLAPGVVLRDATNERTACGREEVLAVLLRWSRAALLTLTLALTLALALTLTNPNPSPSPSPSPNPRRARWAAVRSGARWGAWWALRKPT